MKRTLPLLASRTMAMVLANVVALITTPAQATFPAPTNGEIVFTRFDENADGSRDYEIFTKLPYGTEVEQLTDDESDNESGRIDNEPVYSPDGEKIAWRASPTFVEKGADLDRIGDALCYPRHGHEGARVTSPSSH